ncbi:ABC transporter substrate-binding protein [Rhodococcus wratislaviensis]|uniref:Leucine-binding protein domain-containing protein n=1 Tax=Rhodococcus wratislaviensis NBRC 100605 TaxID=1219028 RepID=X0Q838_RHOWR|nr:ABC transporter substrate-binding protein [Rhodococcus wratislaviensis]GAF47637.1 hypothetical protein RW1_043_00720 [Rhodococcus wratislaviensis NBRC 100605]
MSLLVSACAGGGDSSTTAAAQKADAPPLAEYTGPPADSTHPIKIGVLYTDDNPIGVTPEIKKAAEAGEQYVNSHGGIDGRTIEIVACNGANNPQNTARCATQFVNAHVATVYGLDATWGGVGVEVLNKAGIVNQTLPISGPEFTSDNAYPWLASGLTSASAAATYAAEAGGKAACIYQEFASFKEQCLDYFGGTADAKGVEWTPIPIPPNADDLAQYATKAAGTGAETILMIGGVTSVRQVISSAAQIGFKPQWITATQPSDFYEAMGPLAEGLINFNDLKDANDPNDPDAELFRSIMQTYAPDADTTNFATMIISNLLTLKRLAEEQGVGGEQITQENFANVLKAVKVQQFMGPMLDAAHPIKRYPRAVHTGAYLYQRQADGSVKPAGQGYYEFPETND